MNIHIEVCSEACFFRTWCYLASLKSWSPGPCFNISLKGLMLNDFASCLNKLHNLGYEAKHPTCERRFVIVPAKGRVATIILNYIWLRNCTLRPVPTNICRSHIHTPESTHVNVLETAGQWQPIQHASGLWLVRSSSGHYYDPLFMISRMFVDLKRVSKDPW